MYYKKYISYLHSKVMQKFTATFHIHGSYFFLSQLFQTLMQIQSISPITMHALKQITPIKIKPITIPFPLYSIIWFGLEYKQNKFFFSPYLESLMLLASGKPITVSSEGNWVHYPTAYPLHIVVTCQQYHQKGRKIMIEGWPNCSFLEGCY